MLRSNTPMHLPLLQVFCGLILVSPCCQRPGWWEWAWGHVAARQLQHQGWAPSVKHYFVQRLFGELMQNAMAGESDLLRVGEEGRQGAAVCVRDCLHLRGAAAELHKPGMYHLPAHCVTLLPPHPVPPATHLQAFRRECEQLPPLAAAHYLRAALARPDIKPLLPRLRCRLLLVYGGEALHQADCVELATLVNKGRFAVMEVPQVGALITLYRV